MLPKRWLVTHQCIDCLFVCFSKLNRLNVTCMFFEMTNLHCVHTVYIVAKWFVLSFWMETFWNLATHFICTSFSKYYFFTVCVPSFKLFPLQTRISAINYGTVLKIATVFVTPSNPVMLNSNWLLTVLNYYENRSLLKVGVNQGALLGPHDVL